MLTFTKDFFKWAGALAVAYVLANIFLIPYYHYTPGIPLEVNGTHEIYYPGSVFWTAGEGLSSGRFDENGYLNPSGSEESGYVLVMGSSHTMGKEVPEGMSYSRILTEKYDIPVYNMSMDGHLYPDIISGFAAALKQFPNASGIVIETNFTDFKIDDLENALNQREYDEAYTGRALAEKAQGLTLAKLKIQTWLPYRILLKQKINALMAENEEYERGTEEEYRKALNDTMELMRSIYDKPIVILYHSALEVDEDGNVNASVDNEETLEAFALSCELNDIEFVNMSETFIDDYKENRRFPHGFMNTSVGTGHLNRTGHALVADRLAEVLPSLINGK